MTELTTSLQTRVATLPIGLQSTAQTAVDEISKQILDCEKAFRTSIFRFTAIGEFYKCTSTYYAQGHSQLSAFLTDALATVATVAV